MDQARAESTNLVFSPKMNESKTDHLSKWWLSFAKRKFINCKLSLAEDILISY